MLLLLYIYTTFFLHYRNISYTRLNNIYRNNTILPKLNPTVANTSPYISIIYFFLYNPSHAYTNRLILGVNNY